MISLTLLPEWDSTDSMMDIVQTDHSLVAGTLRLKLRKPAPSKRPTRLELTKEGNYQLPDRGVQPFCPARRRIDQHLPGRRFRSAVAGAERDCLCLGQENLGTAPCTKEAMDLTRDNGPLGAETGGSTQLPRVPCSLVRGKKGGTERQKCGYK